MSKSISQREARLWKRRALAAEQRLKDRHGALTAEPWEAPGVVHAFNLALTGEQHGKASMAAELGCVLVVRRRLDQWIVYAVAQVPTRVEGGAA